MVVRAVFGPRTVALDIDAQDTTTTANQYESLSSKIIVISYVWKQISDMSGSCHQVG